MVGNQWGVEASEWCFPLWAFCFSLIFEQCSGSTCFSQISEEKKTFFKYSSSCLHQVLVVACRVFDLHCRCEFFSAACCGMVPGSGIEPESFHWEYRILATGPLGKSQEENILNKKIERVKKLLRVAFEEVSHEEWHLEARELNSEVPAITLVEWWTQKVSELNLFLFDVCWEWYRLSSLSIWPLSLSLQASMPSPPPAIMLLILRHSFYRRCPRCARVSTWQKSSMRSGEETRTQGSGRGFSGYC